MDVNPNPFKTAGIILLVLGVIDIGIMVYALSEKMAYSSSFNIFAVIAGILLIRGSVKTARLVRMVAAFFISAFALMPVALLIVEPFDLLLLQITQDLVKTLLAGLLVVAAYLAVFYTYKHLNRPEALAALAQAGYKTQTPKLAFAIGGLLVVFIFGGTAVLRQGDSAAQAIALAEQQVGPGYKYHIKVINYSGSSGAAVVAAYNNESVREIKVRW